MRYVYKNQFSELEKIAEDVEAFGQAHALDIKTISTLNLCIEEVFTNIVSYGFGDPASHLIEVTLEWYPNQIELVIEDEGKPFDPLTQAIPPVLDDSMLQRAPGGLGIFFIKEMMDELSYQRLASKNHLKMVKKLN